MNKPPTDNSKNAPASSLGLVVCAVLGLVAAWTAAGSMGLLGHPLRRALTLLCLLPVCVSTLGAIEFSRRNSLILLAGICAGLGLLSASSEPVNVMAVAVLLAMAAWLRQGPEKRPLLIGAMAVTGFAIYRFLLVAVPAFWLTMDKVGNGLGTVAAWPTGQRLWVGATFAGVDYLVLMGLLFGLWIWQSPGHRRRQWWRGAVALVLMHLLFLQVMAAVPLLLAALPAAPANERNFGVEPPWLWNEVLRRLIPWNLPALGCFLHAFLAAYVLRDLTVTLGPEISQPMVQKPLKKLPVKPEWVMAGIIAVLAAVLPLLTALHWQAYSLKNKKIVVFKEGFLNWLKPEHGQYGRLSVGMYGMLPAFLESYGAQCVISPDLAASDIEGADLVVLIYPNKPWAEGQVERILGYVKEGGSLLVLGEHTVHEKTLGGSRFNDVLKPTSMQVAFDSATFEVGGWLQSYQAMIHPTAAGIDDDRNDFGAVIGASVATRWPARPLLVGRWGWNDPGNLANDESKGGSLMGNHRYDGGEKLGDLILAAEQRFGKGRIVVFGDTSGFTNGITTGAHIYTSRLYAYLCGGEWRSFLWHILSALLGLALVGLLFRQRSAGGVAAAAVAFGLSLASATAITYNSVNLLPDGRGKTPNNIAYLDGTHAQQCSEESWRLNGLGGFELTLMRNGYRVLRLHEFTLDRLKRAGMLLSAAPSRPFSRKEKEVLREFIEGGGIFICTVGYPESAGSRDLLAEFELYPGNVEFWDGRGSEPKPFGHFKAPYYNGGDYYAYVRFHAGWSIASTDSSAQPLAYGPRDPKGPKDQKDPNLILMRRLGKGKFVLVGDSQFATNQNLENEGGQPFEGMRENAHFWRWLLTYLNDQPRWIPPNEAKKTNTVDTP